MTAPGNSIVLILLLAAFLACTGYAGGRLHQWYRMGQDRDEAYRDGYDTATRSVFSLAARIISPRRADRSAIRASAAVVIPASSVIETTTSSLPPIASPSPDQGEVPTSSPASHVPPADPPMPSEISLDGPARPLTFRSPQATRSRQDTFTRSGGAGPGVAGPGAAGTGVAGQIPGEAVRRGPAGDAGGLGEALAEPAAVSRPTAVPMDPERLLGTSADGSRPAPEALTSGGRHMVPDELVQAATYRLPPDRVARAKVRGASTPAESAADPTWWPPPVPKPRSNQLP